MMGVGLRDPRRKMWLALPALMSEQSPETASETPCSETQPRTTDNDQAESHYRR